MTLTEDKNGQITGEYKNEAEFLKSYNVQTTELVGYVNRAKSETTTITFCMGWATEGGFSQESWETKKKSYIQNTYSK